MSKLINLAKESIGYRPQLDGKQLDLAQYANILKLENGEELVEFYQHAKTIEYEVLLQKNKTGQLQ